MVGRKLHAAPARRNVTVTVTVTVMVRVTATTGPVLADHDDLDTVSDGDHPSHDHQTPGL